MSDSTNQIPNDQHSFDPIYARNIQRVFRARFKVNEPGYISHITQRAAEKEPLFLDEKDYLTMLGLFKESAERFDLCYYALCLMPNHVHLLLKPKERNLAEAMRSVFSRYAARFNRRYESRGHLFGGRYRQSICLDRTYLLTASVYIHLNPVRGGLAEDAGEYRWSSSALYTLENPGDSFIDPGPVLKLLDEDPARARQEYRQLLKKGRGEEPDNALEHEGAIERFCIRLAELFPSLFQKLGKKADRDQDQSPSLLEVTELEKSLKNLGTGRARGEESKRAKRYIAEQLLARGYKKTEIAERLGVSRAAVYRILDSEYTKRVRREMST